MMLSHRFTRRTHKYTQRRACEAVKRLTGVLWRFWSSTPSRELFMVNVTLESGCTAMYGIYLHLATQNRRALAVAKGKSANKSSCRPKTHTDNRTPYHSTRISTRSTRKGCRQQMAQRIEKCQSTHSTIVWPEKSNAHQRRVKWGGGRTFWVKWCFYQHERAWHAIQTFDKTSGKVEQSGGKK